jgi:hypothetical protein
MEISLFSTIIDGAKFAFSSQDIVIYVALFLSAIALITIGFEPMLSLLFTMMPVALLYTAGFATYGLMPYLIMFNGFILAIAIQRLFLR